MAENRAHTEALEHPLRAWRLGQFRIDHKTKQRRQLSQREAGAQYGVTAQCWHQWENGLRLPGPHHMQQLTPNTGVTAGELNEAYVQKAAA